MGQGGLVMILTLPVIVTRSPLGDSKERKAMRSYVFHRTALASV